MDTFKNSIIIALVFSVAPVSLVAAEEPSVEQRSELLKKIQEVNSQYTELLDKVDAIDEKRRQLELLMYQVDDLQQYRGGMDVSGESPEAMEVATDRKKELEEQNKSIPDLPRISSEVGGVLSPKGRLTVEPSLQFLYSSVNRLAIEGFTVLPALLVGVIDVVEADRNSYMAGLTFRYGVTDRLEMELKGSYVYREDQTRSREFLTGSLNESIYTARGQGLGDLEFGLRYQFKRRKLTSPYIVGNLRVKSDTGSDPFEIAVESTLQELPRYTSELPTGSGFWSVNPSLTFIYPSDPVVFFGNIGYLWTMEDDKGTSLDADGNIVGFGTVDPGDAIRMSFGIGLGLNERSSFSVSYSLDQFTKSWIETAVNQEIDGSDVTIGKLLIGYSLRLGNGTPLNLAVGIGTTDDAPDTDLTFRMPFGFGGH